MPINTNFQIFQLISGTFYAVAISNGKKFVKYKTEEYI